MVAVSGSLLNTAADLRSGRLPLAEYLHEACDRIETVEPHLHALLPEPDRRERLLAEARELQQRYPEDERPPLFGVLLGVKDIYRADGFETRCGSALPAELFAGPEASVVTRLKAAGALVLGKTVTTEFAYFEPGPTGNPHQPEHTPGGSSSGSAAAVGAGYCPLALGSQTIGSVIRPAAFCGVAGFKTSYGQVPLDGVIPYAPSLDHFGFFAPKGEDLPLVLSVLLGETEAPAPEGVLGVPEGPFLDQTEPEARAAFERQVQSLEASGRKVVRVPLFPDIAAINRRHERLAAVELAAIHQEWFARHEALYRPRTAAWIREGQTIDDHEEGLAVLGRAELRRTLHAVMDEHGIDAWICPAAPGPAPRGLASTGNPVLNLPWTYAGLPAATIPAGAAANGLPLGLQIVGRFRSDAATASTARELAHIIK